MELLQPVPGGGEEEAHDLSPAQVEGPGPPAGVLHLVGVAVLIAGPAVKIDEPVGILAEVGGHPVQDHRDALAVQVIHEPAEVLRRAEAGGGSEVAGALVAPGLIQGMLRHRQQLHGGVAQVPDILRQLLPQLPVGKEAPVLVPPPGAQVDLIDVERPAVDRPPLPAVAPVPPGEGALLRQPPRCAGADLRGKGVGVRLVAELAVAAQDRELIELPRLRSGEPGLPDAVLPFHGGGVRVPAVELPHHGDPLGPGGPEAEAPALPLPVGTENAPALAELPPAEGRQPLAVFHGAPPFFE